MNSTTENGRSVLAVAPGDGRLVGFGKLKAGPAEVLVSAGNVPATGRKRFNFELQRLKAQLHCEHVLEAPTKDAWFGWVRLCRRCGFEWVMV